MGIEWNYQEEEIVERMTLALDIYSRLDVPEGLEAHCFNFVGSACMNGSRVIAPPMLLGQMGAIQ